jgi:hypothetical protein
MPVGHQLMNHLDPIGMTGRQLPGHPGVKSVLASSTTMTSTPRKDRSTNEPTARSSRWASLQAMLSAMTTTLTSGIDSTITLAYTTSTESYYSNSMAAIVLLDM